jgi:hypothetical protein
MLFKLKIRLKLIALITIYLKLSFATSSNNNIDNSIYDEYDDDLYDHQRFKSSSSHIFNSDNQPPKSSYNNRNFFIINNNNNNEKCRSDENCDYPNFTCDKSSSQCVKLCDIRLKNISKTSSDNENNNNSTSNFSCEQFHCFGKLLINSNDLNAYSSIETNNYPALGRYLPKRKCSWILKNTNNNESESSQEKNSISYITLTINRFATQFSNDFLYIFAGDSIYSPLIAVLSGPDLSSNEPSSIADNTLKWSKNTLSSSVKRNSVRRQEEFFKVLPNDEEEHDDLNTNLKENKPFNITLFNVKSLYLLFKSDVVSSLISLNPYFYKHSSNYLSSLNFDKPNGISINQK